MKFEVLGEIMKERHITGYWLSKRTGIASPDVYAALKGTKPMYPGYKKRIAEALELSADYLFPTNDEK